MWQSGIIPSQVLNGMAGLSKVDENGQVAQCQNFMLPWTGTVYIKKLLLPGYWWAVGWFIGWLVDWLIGWMNRWLTYAVIGWLVYWCWSLDWMIDCHRLPGWPIDMMDGWIADWLMHWLIGWLIDWLVDWQNGLDVNGIGECYSVCYLNMPVPARYIKSSLNDLL